MRTFLTAVFAFSFPFLAVGCSTVNWSADRVAAGVNTYCDRFTALEREVMRARVNLKTYPDRIAIECAEDQRQ